MNNLAKEIKNGSFHQLYLLMGEEDYLRKQFRDRLKEALIPPDSPGASMNLHYFREKEASLETVLDLLGTVPFFGDRRLIILEDSQLFKNAPDPLLDSFARMPEGACLMFVEKKPDERTKIFKALKAQGVLARFEQQKPPTLMAWCRGRFLEAGLGFSDSALSLLVNQAGPDMNNLKNEQDKLIGYCLEKGQIGEEDVLEICVRDPQDTVFAMVRASASGDTEEALRLYGDLLKRREAPLKILALLARQYRLVLQYLERGSRTDKELVRSMGISPFALKEYASLGRILTAEQAMKALEACGNTDESIKNGKVSDRLGVELLLAGSDRS